MCLKCVRHFLRRRAKSLGADLCDYFKVYILSRLQINCSPQIFNPASLNGEEDYWSIIYLSFVKIIAYIVLALIDERMYSVEKNDIK